MVKDKYSEIADESIKRMMSECIECMRDSGNVELDLAQRIIGPEKAKRLAAMNKVMVRIIRSAPWN